jgi:hypothetical protein
MGWNEFSDIMSLTVERLEVFKPKCVREKGAESGFFEGAVFAGIEDEGVVGAELGEGLAAGTAGHGGGAVEVSDGDGAEADAGAELGDGAGDGSLLGAGGEAVGAVFDVAAGDDDAAFKQEGGTDAEVAVGSIGVFCSSGGERAQAGEVGGRQGRFLSLLRHGESFRVAV